MVHAGSIAVPTLAKEQSHIEQNLQPIIGVYPDMSSKLVLHKDGDPQIQEYATASIDGTNFDSILISKGQILKDNVQIKLTSGVVDVESRLFELRCGGHSYNLTFRFLNTRGESTPAYTSSSITSDGTCYHCKQISDDLMYRPVRADTSKDDNDDFPNYYNSGKYHGGHDFNTASGTSVYAAMDGVVERVENHNTDNYPWGQGPKNIPTFISAYGNSILINHSNTYYTVYAHLAPDSIMVNVGQTVKRGQMIAKVGSTGNSYEFHLHFQVESSLSKYTEYDQYSVSGHKVIDPTTLFTVIESNYDEAHYKTQCNIAHD